MIVGNGIFEEFMWVNKGFMDIYIKDGFYWVDWEKIYYIILEDGEERWDVIKMNL